jgi:hypothetical protein
MLRILAPPLAGKPVAFSAPRPGRTRHRERLSVFKTEERQMLTIFDQVRELRAELAGCLLTRRERAQAQAKLKRLVAEQAEIDRAFALAVAEEAPPD